jgi:hypothetical protein
MGVWKETEILLKKNLYPQKGKRRKINIYKTLPATITLRIYYMI